MKVLYHHRTQAEDGQAVHIRSMIRALREEGHEVRESALVPRGEEAPEPEQSSGGGGKGGGSWLYSLISRVPRFVREIAEYAYTIPARKRLMADARSFRPDFIYERYAFGNAGGIQAAKRLGLPLILEVNSPMVLELGRTRGLSFPRTAERTEKYIFKSADRVAVVTGVLRDMLVEMGVERERIFVTPNGVHPELYSQPDPAAARAELGLAADAGPVLGFVGYYRDWHRLDLVVEALAQTELQSAHLVLIGEGPAEESLRAAAARVGVGERVHFAGARPHTRIPALLPAFDVALVPAINPYASPLKLHEYMAAGLAVIAPDQPNLREVLRTEENALLIPTDDGDALCAALVRLVQDEALRERLGAAAKRSIEEDELTWRGNARRVLRVVEELL